MKTNAKTLMLMMVMLCMANLAAAQPDITWYHPINWDAPLVPSNHEQYGAGVLLGPVLDGNQMTTYWNIAWMNVGNSSTDQFFDSTLLLDGEYCGQWEEFQEVTPGNLVTARNRGPLLVRGGRHTLAVHHDSENMVFESDETNNNWGSQHVWTPYNLSNSSTITRSQPPDPFGGSEDMPGGTWLPNCDGFGIQINSSWSVVGAYAMDLNSDYDLYLYDEPAVWDQGFSSSIAHSNFGPDLLEALILNQWQVGTNNFNIGVQKYSGQGDYKIKNCFNNEVYSEQTISGYIDASEFMQLYTFWVASSQTGVKLLDISSSQDSNLRLSVFDPAFIMGNLLDAPGQAVTDEDGNIRLAFDFTTAGWHAMVVYRNKVDGYPHQDFDFTIRDAVDLEPAHLATWHSPLVPRPQADGTPQSVPLPTSLPGGEGYSTYFNLAFRNAGPSPVENPQILVYMDGLGEDPNHSIYQAYIGTLPSGGTFVDNNIGPRIMPGGRHTWTLEVDPNDAIEEIDEGNNIWGEQYVWMPPLLAFGSHYEGTCAGDLDSGLETITSGEPLFLNCNGYRITRDPSRYWRAVAVSHEPDNDIDLTLFEVSTGPKNGFDDYLSYSGFEDDYVDYILVNDNLPISDNLDVGVERYSGDSGQYNLDLEESQMVNNPTAAQLGPYHLGSQELIHVFDIYLEAGVYNFRLDNVAGQVDWGMQLHPHDVDYQRRSDHVPDGVSFDNEPGRGEFMLVDLPQGGWYGLTVYKSKVEDADKYGIYRVTINPGITPVNDSIIPANTAINTISPNPFNPKTTVSYALDKPGPVRLEVYDLQGALIRTLVKENLPAGQHEATWSGIDQQGREVPSGVYLARIRAGEYDGTRKMMLLK